MPGKYSKLRGKLTAFVEDKEYQELVDDAKQWLLGTLDGEGANINRLAALYATYEEKRDALYKTYNSSETTDAEYEINIYRKALSQLLTDAFEEQGMDRVVLSSGASVTLEDKPIPVIKDKNEAIEWAIDEMPELLTVSFKGITGQQLRSLLAWGKEKKLEAVIGVHSGTLAALVREKCAEMISKKLKGGIPLPSWCEVFLLTQARLKSSKNGDANDEA